MRTRKRIDKQESKPDLTPQTRKRTKIALADSYNGASSAIDSIDLPREELSIRRLRKGFGIYHRVLIKKEKKK